LVLEGISMQLAAEQADIEEKLQIKLCGIKNNNRIGMRDNFDDLNETK
jgi:hypothetical protein